MEEYIGKICPYCKTEIMEGDPVKVCPQCGIPHHEACWVENGGCTTFGCTQQHYAEQHTNPTDVCGTCGAPLGDGQAFCPNCGTPRSVRRKPVCGNCGTELEEGQVFCPNCGQRRDLQVDPAVNSMISQYNNGVSQGNGKKKKTILIAGIAAAAVVVIAIIAILLAKPKGVSEITLSKSSVTIERGETVTLDYTVKPSKASNTEVEWTSDDSSVAEVEDGVVTAKTVGTCEIEVKTDNGKSSTCRVTVKMPEIEKKVVGTWKATELLNLDTMDTSRLSSLGLNWKLKLYDDNTGEFVADSIDPLEFVWIYSSSMSDSDSDFYVTSSDAIWFSFSKEYKEIWLYIITDDINWCITCEK